ncbi:HD domain-containing protein [Robertmurraya yapensis]|uniref:HD domain-containing protein n=2 Tax=Bacillaceae TaxID=186817 RepID=A0A431VZ73_9BACI|nr:MULTISPECIES: HD domain-containing phosphohydrolase [Bacillaceae]RTR28189.1 HD domain-containing protein [Bacillus yapensis]TKC15112.1 HD domain-containing protein [Robertmurraya kyonggiensis]TKS94433.1 HD domain-containing protein [Bacillus yapensis]
MSFFQAKFEFIRMKEIFQGESEWEKAFALFHCLTLRDLATAEHSIEVAYYAAKIADKLGLDASRYYLAGLLHDIGKISMEDHPLKTSEVLSEKERLKLHDHVLNGVLTLSELGFGEDVVKFCLRHHERQNGYGYPFGVDNENIPLEGKIAQVADVFSALTSTREYRENQKSFTLEQALEIMKDEMKNKNAYDHSILSLFEEIVYQDLIDKLQYA